MVLHFNLLYSNQNEGPEWIHYIFVFVLEMAISSFLSRDWPWIIYSFEYYDRKSKNRFISEISLLLYGNTCYPSPCDIYLHISFHIIMWTYMLPTILPFNLCTMTWRTDFKSFASNYTIQILLFLAQSGKKILFTQICPHTMLLFTTAK